MTTLAPVPAEDSFAVETDAAALKASSAKGSMLFAAAQGFRLFLQIASQVALARLLFPSEFGVVAMVYPIVNFASIFSVGFGEAVVQRQSLTQDQVSSLFWISIVFGWVLAAALWAVAPLVGWFLGEPRLVPLLLVTALSVPIGALGGAQAALLTRQMQFGAIVMNELVSAVIGTAVTIAAAWAGWSYWALVVGLFALAISNATLNWRASSWRPSRPRLAGLVGDDLRFGSNVTGYNLANFLTSSGDTLIVGYMNGSYALGLYDRSYRLVVQPVGQLVAPLGRVVVPLLSRLLDDAIEYRNAYLATVKAIMVATVPGMLVCVLFGDVVVEVLLGPRWTEAGVVLSWLSVSGLTSGIQLTAVWLLMSQARLGGLRKLTVITSVLSLGSYLLGSLWGLRGVAISVGLIFSCVTTPIIMLGATRSGPVGRRHIARACLPFIGAAGLAAVLMWSFRTVEVGSPILRLAFAGSIAYAVFAAVVVAIPAERRMFSQMFATFRGSRSIGSEGVASA